MPGDFVKFGLIPELIGRVPVVVSLRELDEEALIRILKEPKNSLIRQYEKLFAMDGVRLVVEEDAIRAIAKETIERKTGARGLRQVVEKIVMEPMFTVPSDKTITECRITKEVVEGTAEPVLIRGKKSEETKKSNEDKKRRS